MVPRRSSRCGGWAHRPGGALVDREDLRVAEPPLDRVVVDVTVLARDLDRLLGDADSNLGRNELGGQLDPTGAADKLDATPQSEVTEALLAPLPPLTSWVASASTRASLSPV